MEYYNRRGMSLSYTVIAIALVGIISATLLNLSHSQQMAQISFTNSQSARSAVHSGFTKALAFFETADSTDQEEVVTFLNRWANDSKNKEVWLIGDDDSYDSLDTHTRFRVQVTGFDPHTSAISLYSEGIGRGGARASAMGVYRLEGMGDEEREIPNQNAIYMEDDVSLELRGPVQINGGTRFSSSVNFDEQTSGSVFNGFFQTQASDGQMVYKGHFEFTDNALFYTRPRLELRSHPSIQPSSFTFRGKGGFPEGAVSAGADAPFVFAEDTSSSFWLENPQIDWGDGNYNFNNRSIYYAEGAFPNESWIDGDNNTIHGPSMTVEYIEDSLSLPPECPYSINLDVIPDDKIIDLSSTDADATYFENLATSNATWNGFTVIRISDATVNVYDTGSLITSRFIVIVENNGTLQPTSTGSMFSVEPNGHFTIINNGGAVSNIGGWDYFRGLFYRMSGTFHVGGSENTVDNFQGAIYVQYDEEGGAIQWYPSFPSANATITFDAVVLNELDVKGDGNGDRRFLCFSCEEEEEEIEVVIVEDRLRGVLLSRSF
ncbi:hypothetical protein [Chitinivibrio alkaliphilus]|uniref:Uncharacterized protein n=1 Tax=Chitinivibrio alkaliphilus ACht1 TaxID=1313304 RepID=U7DDV8_9BACT|nr:hypothetical protein [Chitinivibrio alkaliphilus]ERP39086.1 hypothetical protein CALK_0251 [Chitinivibrio alkaliphilus ACht1]